MSKPRTFQPRQDITTSSLNRPALDVTRPVALYGRHSTGEQFGNVATSQQTVGLERLALKLGIVQELHRTFYEDLKGVSAYKVPMDERKSYSDLYNAIAQGKIGTVICFLIDRLFRTKNGEEWELFINACVKNNVKVITAAHPMRIFDLSISSDADEFRQKCIDARKYVEVTIKGRMNAARDDLIALGLWCGQGVPVGYYVDLDDTSPTYRHYFIYEPHAAIIRAIFKRYKELGGAFNKLGRELEGRQPVFPLFEGLDKLPSIQLEMNEAKTGYLLGRHGLINILTNPMYIGLNMYLGIKKENNHDAIVDESDFFYAFDRLSRFSLDGEEKRTARTRDNGYSGAIKQGVEALLRGKIQNRDKLATTLSAHNLYAIKSDSHGYNHYEVHASISTIDSIFAERLVAMLTIWKEHATHAQDDSSELVMAANQGATLLTKEFETIVQASETVLASVDDQIPHIKARIAKLRRNLDLDADEETLASWAKELKEKVKELARLEAKQKAIAESQDSQEDAAQLFEQVPEQWERMKFEKKRRVVLLALDHVELLEVAPHFLCMKIMWALPLYITETLYVWRHDGAMSPWAKEDDAFLKEHYLNTPCNEILDALPTKTWATVKHHATATLHLKRNFRYLEGPRLPLNMTMEDMRFMQAQSEVDFSKLNTANEVQVFTPKKVNLHILAPRSQDYPSIDLPGSGLQKKRLDQPVPGFVVVV